MVIGVIVTFAIDKALLIGFVVYIVGLLVSGQRNRISKYMVISTVLLLIGAVLAIVS